MAEASHRARMDPCEAVYAYLRSVAFPNAHVVINSEQHWVGVNMQGGNFVIRILPDIGYIRLKIKFLETVHDLVEHVGDECIMVLEWFFQRHEWCLHEHPLELTLAFRHDAARFIERLIKYLVRSEFIVRFALRR